MAKLLAALAVAAAVIGAALYGASLWVDHVMTSPQLIASAQRVDIRPGATVRSALAQLDSAGLMPDPRLTELYLRAHHQMFALKAGRYEIAPNSSPLDVLALLRSGKVVLEQVTIIEGSTFADLRRTLESHAEIRNTLKGRSAEELMGALGHPNELPEGRFFPDTYRFAAGTTDVELLKLAYERMHTTVETAWSGRIEGLPLKSSYEALTLASIVEKETGLRDERPHIASVFINRLRSGMRLQSDPTVIYGIGPSYDGDIRSRDLVADTPFNTYTRAGLTPTPIALPGGESIVAVAHPAQTNDLYFVAVGDGSGAHEFTSTLEAHNAAVKRYLERIRTQHAGAHQ